LLTKTSPIDSAGASSLYADAQAAVRAYAAGASIDAAAAAAFGADISGAAVAAAVRAFDRYGWARLELVDDEVLHGARGAYDRQSDTIYLSRQYASDTSSTAVVGVLVEEIGHAIDARVNGTDAAGDEGAIFAQFVLGNVPDAGTLAALHAENDHTTIIVDGHAAAVELAGPVVGTITLDGALTDWSAADQIDKPDSTSTTGYNIYGKVTGGSFVFALQAPVAIGANTTAWFNTDQNVTTGFKIFGEPGGAEFNVNFDATGTPHLYTGAAGATAVPGVTVSFGYSADKHVVEFAVPTTALGSPRIAGTLWDVNDGATLPGNYWGPQYDVIDPAGLPARTDFTRQIGIVFSDTSAAKYFDKTAYSQLFMAAQNQAAMAGVHYDILTETDLTDLSKLVNYDALLFPNFTNVQSGQLSAIETNLKLAVDHYKIGLIASGDFMTNNQTGAALPVDPYERMKALFDLQPVNGGFPADVTVRASDITHAVMQDYTANEVIHTYTAAGWLAYQPVAPAGTAVLATQTVGGQTYDAVIATTPGGRNVHFSTDEVMADNNLLWQAIDYAVNGNGITAGLQLSRNASIVAARNDMDQAMERLDVDPQSGAPGIYDKLIPILQQWKSQYNFVGSYYVDIGANPPDQQTIWAQSGVYYKQLLDMGNELGSHSVTHPENTNTLTPAQIQSEFEGSKQIIEQQMSQFLGQSFTVTGAAVPGASETLATALSIIQYYDYLSGGFSGVGAGFPGAIGYLNPAMAAQDKVYLAPNVQFDFTLVEFKGMTPAQASAEWQREWNELTAHSDVPVLVWPWHDYAGAAWATNPPATSPYTTAMFTQFISQAYAAGAEFVTLADLADRVSSFNDSSVTTTISGNTVAASVVSPDAGRFALDLDNLVGTQKIASVNGWYAYDNDSVFLDRDGGNFTINLGAAVADVTHITSLPMRAELVSLSGDGTNLSFSVVGEGRVVIDLANPAGRQPVVTGANVVSLAGDILTLDVGAIGAHNVSVFMAPLVLDRNASIDFNGDRASDLLWRNSDGAVGLWEMHGAVSYGSGLGAPALTASIVDAHGDFGGDGKSDILWRDTAGAVSIWEMNGARASIQPVASAPTSWTIVDGHGDYNGDGSSDIAWRNTDGSVGLWEMHGAQSYGHSAGALALSWSLVSAHADFDANGRSDLLFRNTDGAMVIWSVNSDWSISSQSLDLVAPAWNTVDTGGDYNGDGKNDLLVRAQDGAVAIWQISGGHVSSQSIGAVPLSWTLLDGHGDYNGDHNSDLLWRNSDGSVATWQMTASGPQGGVIGTIAASWTLVDGHADYNADGKSDLLWRNTDGTTRIWQMNGPQAAIATIGTPPTSWKLIDGAEMGASIGGDSTGNVLAGTVGRDTINGAAGADTLTGGPGADRFVFAAPLSASTNVDSVTDFTPGTDTLALSDVIFPTLAKGPLAAGALVSSGAPVGADANDRILYNTTTGVVSYDPDGSGPASATAFATLSNHPALTAADIYVGLF
jgi:Ca2+-binding RTX toxin-like protein